MSSQTISLYKVYHNQLQNQIRERSSIKFLCLRERLVVYRQMYAQLRIPTVGN